VCERERESERERKIEAKLSYTGLDRSPRVLGV
jgi:hypothetical protein